ncbi:MAG: hypothetical protein ACSLFC_14095 [Desulfuromonadales bacterium]
MKKLIQALCSVFFVTAMVLPSDALANSAEEYKETSEEQAVQTGKADDYHLAFLSGDFGLQFNRTQMTDQFETLVMFISNPDGKVVKDAQVITTVIDQNGTQLMRRARPLKGGYLIDTAHLAPGPYRLEAEIVTNGWLLTDQFIFQKV